MDAKLYEGLRQFDCTLDGEPLDVYEFELSEAMFSHFRATVTVVSRVHLKTEEYIGKDAELTLLGRRTDRFFHGMIESMEELNERGRYYLFKAVIVPPLKRLSYIRDVRMFQNMTVPEIIEDVLKKSGLVSMMYELRFSKTYKPREYCVQYRETNLAFVRRIMSEEGIFYYYEYEQGKALLVFGDTMACHNTIPGKPELIFSPKGQLVEETEYVTRFDVTDALFTGKVYLKDYDFEKPSYKPLSQASGRDFDDLELYDYPGYLTHDQYQMSVAQIHEQRLENKGQTMKGDSVCRRFIPGHRFTLSEHYTEPFNREYILTQVIHTGKQPQALQELAGSGEGNSYGNTFICMNSDLHFRPPRLRKPSVQGIQTAVVTGPESEEIFTDEYGRIKVRFHWDRDTPPEDKTSCWMRVAQPWAGAGWGSVFIPRIGQEVVVSFIDGDPDKPLVTGAVYNGRNFLPLDLPAEKTKSTMKTRSTPDSKGFNEFRFEDKKGEEEIYFHGEKDWNIDINNDKTQHIGHDESLTVDNDKTISIGKNHDETIGENMSISVGKNLSESTGENKSVTVGKNHTEDIGENSTITIQKNNSIDIGENLSVKVGKDGAVNIGKNLGITVDKKLNSTTKDSVMVSSDKEIVFKTGSASITMKKNGDIIIQGGKITIKGSKDLVMKGSKMGGN